MQEPAHRLIIVSNRLPVSVERGPDGSTLFSPSVGGLATGLDSVHDAYDSHWVGWADVDIGDMTLAEVADLTRTISTEYRCTPVFLSTEDVEGYYRGFSNRTIWPLFHYFTRYAEFDSGMWEAYERVNRTFAEAVCEVARPGDVIWVQDYQLMLLPSMLRERIPDATIGWFLHIPFPSYEIFRILPWRREVLRGLLGADLVGFHTYDYARHFITSCTRLLGLEEQTGRLIVDERLVVVDAFPMGIDYERYRDAARTPEAISEAEQIGLRTEDCEVVLSVDRLDYTKGIPERLRAFGAFLDRYPEWRGKVTLVCVAVPSREGVETYRQLKMEIDELVGSINGRYGTLEWTPIRYLNRSLPLETLAAMYGAAKVALVTPLRDGMNLIAKEYLAAHDGQGGVLVLSEMAGAANELGEALLVNPFDRDQIVEALREALLMDEPEARTRNALMQRRLRRYTVAKWAAEFLGALESAKTEQAGLDARRLDPEQQEALISAYRKARRRLLLFDYDGTLVTFSSRPEEASPGPDLRELLRRLAEDPANDLVIVSGRDRDTLEAWFGGLDVGLVAEHGVWLRTADGDWVTVEPMSDQWKPRVAGLLEMFVDRTPGSFVEEKDYSLVWHYRQVNDELARARVVELKGSLASVMSDWNLAIMEGDKVLEVKVADVNKGRAAHLWMCREDLDFILVAGDDRTDEDMFDVAPEGAWTIKVGRGPTQAGHSVRNVSQFRALLTDLADVSRKGGTRV
ncbi:MAG: bifunctional alpha,alpha-trehalose-phosphate synthase (UDP-forming)/trehalose-phosphatase [Actinomycetia bacterium]|nr:bifunctional alpha,alpha-trehalose-phosphate synthase (UDP-forming)/trehalose-phosphatase [Actinomycetes bacterium]